MKSIKVKRGVILFFSFWILFIEAMVVAGIIILANTNHYKWESIVLGIGGFLTIFNVFLYLFLGSFVKEIVKTNEEIRVSLFKGKYYSYSLSDWTFTAQTIINGRGEKRSVNYFLLISNKKESKDKWFKIGLFTQIQRKEINCL